MAETYTPPTIANFNDNPPDDDGSIVESNRITWQKHLDEIGGPLKTYADAINSATETAFDNILANNLAISVKDPRYGAAGDGTTDDTLAINAAISAASGLDNAVVYFPPGTYLCNSSIDATDKPGISLVGAGRGAVTLKLDTDDVGIDFSGSAWARAKGFTIDNRGLSTQATCCMLFMRSTTSPAGDQCDNCKVEDVQIWTDYDNTANGNTGIVGIYANASEEFTAENVFITSDYPMVITATDSLSINSPFVTRDTPTSCVMFNLKMCSFVSSKYGPSLDIDLAGHVYCDNCYWSADGSAPGSYEYCVRVNGGSNNIFLKGTGEAGAQDYFAEFTGSVIIGEIRVTVKSGASTTHWIGIANTHVLGDFKITIFDTNDGTYSVPVVMKTGASAGIAHCEFYLMTNQSIDATLVSTGLKVIYRTLGYTYRHGSGQYVAPVSSNHFAGSFGTNWSYAEDTDLNIDSTMFYCSIAAVTTGRNANLPAATNAGRMYIIVKADASGNAVTIVPDGTDQVVGSTSLASQGDVARLIDNGAGVWHRW